MTVATSMTASLALHLVPLKSELAAELAEPPVTAPEVMDQLSLVLRAGRPGGLSGVGSEQALRVVEAVEAVKAWADSVSLDATARMVAELESDFSDLAVERPTVKGWTRFLRSCRSVAAREIQVATGLPITQCQGRVWLAVCEPERVQPVRDGMRLGLVTFARAVALTEATAHLDALTAAAIATRVLRPLTGPDGVPLPGLAPLSQATFAARLRTQLVLHHGLVGEAERTYAEATQGAPNVCRAQPRWHRGVGGHRGRGKDHRRTVPGRPDRPATASGR